MAKYHFRPTEKTTSDPHVVDNIISNGKYMVIALCRNDEPYVVTLSYGYDREKQALYCHCAKKGLKLDFIRANNRVCGTVIMDGGYLQGECAQPFESIVFRGTIGEVHDLDEKKHAMSVLLNHLEDDPNIVQERSLKKDDIYDSIGMLRINLEEMRAKKGR
ncbi:pyridoxamine 5'-phosphate oxidase family protein [Candidatus Latescibacterota bacterium]